MATAGKPLNARPSSVRIPRKEDQEGANGERVVRIAEENMDTVITDLRPHASETEPASKIATAMEAVTDEMAKLLAAALM
jgi:hypothetical protein